LGGPVREAYFLPGARTISGVKVDHSDIGLRPAYLVIGWCDRNDRARSLTFDGDQAAEIITDLHACSLLGEAARLTYLIGYLRSHNHQDGGGG
jgi:hypothetical protein